MEIGGHSHSHPELDQLSDGRLRDELTRNKELLENRLGRVVTTMSRGRVIVSDGELRGAPGDGKFIPRDLNQYLT